MKKTALSTTLILFLAILHNSCQWLELLEPVPVTTEKPLLEVARSNRQWTGVTISKESRIFVNYPNWSPDHTLSVAEVTDTASVVAYPNEEWNTWNESLDPSEHFVCVQSVWVDDQNSLWVLDPANPQRNGKYLGVVEGGAKLVKIDLSTGQVVKKYIFSQPVIEPNSYLNDVRIDTKLEYAYMTDSNEGALVVLNFATGEARRVLSKHPSTKSENIVFEIDGKVWRLPDGSLPSVDSDGIALDAAGEYLYYQALTGKSLYRIATKWLRDATLPETELEQKVEFVASVAAADGIIFGPDGYLYLTDVPGKAVQKYRIRGKQTLVVRDEQLKWPDTFTVGADGYLYVTTSQIHIPNPTEPYRLFKIPLH